MVGVAVGFVVTFVTSLLLLHAKHTLVVRIKPELADVQGAKAGTPSVGGIAIVLGATAACIATRPDPAYLLVLWTFALIGFWDDTAKTHSDNGDGITSLQKLLAQGTASVLIVLLLSATGRIPADCLYACFSVVWIMLYANAVNITDGMDGLAALVSIPPLVLLDVLDPHPALSGFIASLAAFLCFNVKPARYFMGDTGSEAIGAVMAVTALLARREQTLLVASLPLLVELASSFAQIVAIRMFGRKLFSIAPLHHDLQKHGMGEWAVVLLFFGASILCTLVAFALVGR